MAGERILVVDDEPRIVRLCTQILTEQGYLVQGVSSGMEALSQLRAEAFDLLIVDIKMPDVDGLLVLRLARDLDPNLTAVVITGSATMDRAIEALQAGARGFILKPFGFDELISTIEGALGQRRKEEERLHLQAQLPILEISHFLMSEANVVSLAQRLLEILVQQMEADRGLLLLLSEDPNELYVAAAIGLPDGALDGTEMVANRGSTAKGLLSEGPLVLGTHSSAHVDAPWQKLVIEPDATDLMLLPLRTREKDVGVLGLGRLAGKRPRTSFTPTDLNLLSIVGRQIAIALENTRLYALEQRRTAELARTLVQQQELDRLKDEFMQNVSHELRTPLSMILGYAEMLTSGELGEIGPRQQGAIETIMQRAMILKDLIENITAILDNRDREPLTGLVSMVELVASTLADFGVLAQQSELELHGQITNQVPFVQGDPEHLRKMVDNLIANALKFTPAGGTVNVSLRGTSDEVILQVIDTGIGIPEEHLERIFDRFYQVDGTTRRRHGGSGLGLALVKEISETHGGSVTVESQVGQGSTFTVRLPAAEVNRKGYRS
jgi:signal transduction histidine kinase/DNA-binding response OmpR family regulator